MSQSPPPPPPYPALPPHQQRPPANGPAVAALVIGIVALLVALVPLVNLVGVVGALVAIPLGIAGLRRGRRTGRGSGMAGTGIGLSTVAILVSVVVSFLFWRYLGDLLDWVDPPDPSASVGEEFETDDGDLTVTVTSVTCLAAPDGPGHDCEFVFDARNTGDRHLYLDNIRVKAVVDGAFVDPYLGGDLSLDPGQEAQGTGSISVYDGELEGLAFDADDASSHSAVVVDTRAAWESAAEGK